MDYTELIQRLERSVNMSGPDTYGEAAKAIKQLLQERELDEQRVADLMTKLMVLETALREVNKTLKEIKKCSRLLEGSYIIHEKMNNKLHKATTIINKVLAEE